MIESYRNMKSLFGLAAILFVLTLPTLVKAQVVNDQTATHFATLALTCISQEYPNKISHIMRGDEDVKPPRELHPAFYGCYDWHSSVHGHWMIVRLLRMVPDASFRDQAILALDHNLNMVSIAGEVGYLDHEERKSYERPYGLAWVLQLSMELRAWQQDETADILDRELAGKWLRAIEPLETAVIEKLTHWLPNLSYPIRLGTHNQTAFAFGLILDWARQKGDLDVEGLMQARINHYYSGDTNCPIGYEPSGEDFLSPCLMEADLMRRVLNRDEFSAWLGTFLPDIPTDGTADWLTPAFVTDITDGKIVHLDGLNLSRSWALQGIASALTPTDPRRASLLAASAQHGYSGLQAVTGENYAGGHWLASFATYLVTKRGLGD